MNEVEYIAASGSRTNFVSEDITNSDQTGVIVSANVMTGPIVVTIEGKDVVSQKYYPILRSAGLTDGLTNLTVYPGVAAVANASVSSVLPHVWRVTASGVGIFSIGASVID